MGMKPVDQFIAMGENTVMESLLAVELQSTATRTSGKQSNPRYRGILLIVTIANEAGTCSFQPKINAYDAAGNAIVLATFTALTANGTYLLEFYPAVLTGFAGSESKVGQLPREWSVSLVYSGTPANDKMDTTVDYCYLV